MDKKLYISVLVKFISNIALRKVNSYSILLLSVEVPEFGGANYSKSSEGHAMGQVLHGSATTTPAVRQAIKESRESLRVLADRFGVNPKTIAKWRSRDSVADLKTGPKHPHSTVLSSDEEATIVAFRCYTMLPLDDCLQALRLSIPHLTRSTLHRCLKRHGVSRLSQIDNDIALKKKQKLRSHAER